MQQSSSQPYFSVPLVTALEDIGFRLKREDAARIVVATARKSELQERDLPSQLKVIGRPLKGRRVAVRNARHFQQTRLRIAHYPESLMDEWAVPVLLCVLSGQARIHAGNYILQSQPGNFVLIPPMVPKGNFSHALDGDPQNSCDVLYIYPGRLLGSGLECWIAHSQGEKIETHSGTLLKSGFLATLFEQVANEAKESPNSQVTFFLINSLISFLLRELKEGRGLVPPAQRVYMQGEQADGPIRYALSYIESHLHLQLTIEHMARETALSATSFKLLFRQATGQSFHQYLTLCRLDLAERLLRESELKIHDVARYIGLSPSQFNRLFQDYHSCAPGEYRKQK